MPNALNAADVLSSPLQQVCICTASSLLCFASHCSAHLLSSLTMHTPLLPFCPSAVEPGQGQQHAGPAVAGARQQAVGAAACDGAPDALRPRPLVPADLNGA